MYTRWFIAASLLLILGVAGVAILRPKNDPSPSIPSPKEVDPPVQAFFEDVTSSSGVRFTYHNGESTANHLAILESLGGGVGLIDYDGDGLLDIFFPGGGDYSGPEKKDIVGLPCKLFRNLGQGKFADVTHSVGLHQRGDGKPWFYSHGVAVADYDRDGRPDLLVTGWGAVALFRNVAVDPKDPSKGRRFEDVTEKVGLGTGITWATSAAFADLDGDGFPDLYVCQYVDWSWKKHPSCTYDGKTPDVCPPKNFDGLPHKLYRNTGKGTFLDVSAEAGLRRGGPTESKGLGVIIVDFDGDGKPDIYVANDTVDNFLYMNRSRPGEIRLEEKGQLSGVAIDDRGSPNGSMGLATGDPDRNGKPALWVTNYENELHALYRNESRVGVPFFLFRTAASGIAAIGQNYVGWGTTFLDVNLDGWEDIFVSNGHAIRYPVGKAVQRLQRPVLLLNNGGKFREASKQIGKYYETPHLGRGLAGGDLDNDGRLDLVISNMNEPSAILRGIGGPDNNWLGVKLTSKGNACEIGVKVELQLGDQKLTRFTRAGGSYASSHDQRLLFGMGQEKPGRLTVTWKDGSKQSFDGLQPNRYYHLIQGSDKALPLYAQK